MSEDFISLPRLLRHDLTLSWRRMRGFLHADDNNAKALAIVGAVIAGIHAAAYPFAVKLSHVTAEGGAFAVLGMGLVIVLPWLFSQGMTASTRALYSRGDLDLLIASPLPPQKILASRALAVAVESFAAVGVFLLPVVDMAAWINGPSWLAIYPTLAATVLIETGLTLALTLGLFRLLGPRKTRAATQVLATLVGAWFVICAQIFNTLPVASREELRQALAHPIAGSWADPAMPWWLPARAAAGEVWPLVLWAALGLGVFLVVVRTLARSFNDGVLVAAGEAQGGRRATRDAPFRCERAGALRRKEWRLLSRDPYLLSQVLLQSLYTLPIVHIIWKGMGPNGSLAVSVAPALVAVTSQLAAALAFLAASSEDAGDFLATAPVASREILIRKLQAIFTPVALFLALPLIGVAWANPRVAVVTLCVASAASASTASLNFWKPLKNKRNDLNKRHQQNKLVGLVEHGISLFWAVAALLACFNVWAAMPPALIAVGLLAANAPSRRGRHA